MEGLPSEEARLVGQGFARKVDERRIRLLDPRELHADLGEDDRVYRQGRVLGGLPERVLGPGRPGLVLGDDVEQNVRVDERLHRLPRISAMISSVVSLFDGRTLRMWPTTPSPRDSLRPRRALRSRASPSTISKVTSVFGRRPSSSRISCGIVTWPLGVIRMAGLLPRPVIPRTACAQERGVARSALRI